MAGVDELEEEHAAVLVDRQVADLIASIDEAEFVQVLDLLALDARLEGEVELAQGLDRGQPRGARSSPPDRARYDRLISPPDRVSLLPSLVHGGPHRSRRDDLAAVGCRPHSSLMVLSRAGTSTRTPGSNGSSSFASATTNLTAVAASSSAVASLPSVRSARCR